MERNRRKTKIGIVVNRVAQKTIKLRIVKKEPHPIYGKYITKTTKLLIDDPNNQCQVGDTVQIMETRPLSKKKCWRVEKILKTHNHDKARNKA